MKLFKTIISCSFFLPKIGKIRHCSLLCLGVILCSLTFFATSSEAKNTSNNQTSTESIEQKTDANVQTAENLREEKSKTKASPSEKNAISQSSKDQTENNHGAKPASKSYRITPNQVGANGVRASHVGAADAVLPMLGALSGVLALIFLLSWLLKKVNPAGLRLSKIRVLESQAIGMKSRLLLVEVEGERLLLGATAQSIEKLHQLSPSDVSNHSHLQKSQAKTNETSGFKKVLGQLIGITSADSTTKSTSHAARTTSEEKVQ